MNNMYRVKIFTLVLIGAFFSPLPARGAEVSTARVPVAFLSPAPQLNTQTLKSLFSFRRYYRVPDLEELEFLEPATPRVWKARNRGNDEIWYVKIGAEQDDFLGMVLAEIFKLNVPPFARFTVTKKQVEEKIPAVHKSDRLFQTYPKDSIDVLIARDVYSLKMNELGQEGTGLEALLVHIANVGFADHDYNHNNREVEIDGLGRYVVFDLGLDDDSYFSLTPDPIIRSNFLFRVFNKTDPGKIEQYVKSVEAMSPKLLKLLLESYGVEELTARDLAARFKAKKKILRLKVLTSIQQAYLRSNYFFCPVFSLNRPALDDYYAYYFLLTPDSDRIWELMIRDMLWNDPEKLALFREMLSYDKEQLSEYTRRHNPFLQNDLARYRNFLKETIGFLTGKYINEQGVAVGFAGIRDRLREAVKSGEDRKIQVERQLRLLEELDISNSEIFRRIDTIESLLFPGQNFLQSAV